MPWYLKKRQGTHFLVNLKNEMHNCIDLIKIRYKQN